MAGIDPWERQPHEPDRAWRAFTVYRDFGPGERTLVKVREKCGVARRLVERWSSRWGWVARCDAYDRDCDRRFRAEMRTARMDLARRHQKIAAAVMGKVVARLQSIDPNTLTASELIRWFQVAAEVERAAVGAYDDHDTDVQHAAGLVTELVATLRRG